jgi:hypothetical protein
MTEPSDRLRIEIVGFDLPGRTSRPGSDHGDVHVAVEARGGQLLGLTPGDASSATWELDATAAAAPGGSIDVRGRPVQGAPGGRFIYLSWGTVDGQGVFERFRRAKLLLSAVPPEVMQAAVEHGVLVGRVGLTDAKGQPLCASVRPPAIVWSAGR